MGLAKITWSFEPDQTSSYGGLLTPALISKLPTELRLMISRELRKDSGNSGQCWKLWRERYIVAAREQSIGLLT